jgi:hypothetical protein
MSPTDESDLAVEWIKDADEAFLDAGLVTKPDALPVEDGPFDFWMPPHGHAGADWDREVGGPVDRILLSGRESTNCFDRALLKSRISELSQPLRALVRKIQRPFLARQVLDWVEGHLNALAHKDGAFVNASSLNLPGSRWYIPAIHRRRYLKAFASNRSWVEEAQAKVRDAITLAHETSVFASWPRPLPTGLPSSSCPSHGTWQCESWLGLSQRSIAEDLPEGALLGTAQRLWAGLSASMRPSHVLHWGALASTLTLALMATRPGLGKPLHLHEVETLGQPQDLPWIRGRSQQVPVEPKTFDGIVCHLPPPGDGANQWRNRYKDLGTVGDSERSCRDIGRLGPKKWKKARRRLLADLAQRLGPAAELVVFHPVAVRTVEVESGIWGYKPARELADGLPEDLEALDLEVIADILIEELNPVFVAPFGTSRCTWRCVIARHDVTLGTTNPLINAAINEVIARG